MMNTPKKSIANGLKCRKAVYLGTGDNGNTQHLQKVLRHSVKIVYDF